MKDPKSSVDSFPQITFGRVVDTNDPQQMGRLRVMCPALYDTPDKKLRNLPWATYAAPFAGITERGSRGRDDDLSTGPVAYGMWNIPKVGATVLIACIDGDTSLRVWLGCIHNQLLAHTMPHGRFSYRDQEVLFSGAGWSEETGKPIGPFTSQEEKIEPTFTQLNLAFTPSLDTVGAGTENLKSQTNFEWRTRGADCAVSGLSHNINFSDVSNTSLMPDDTEDAILLSELEDGFLEPDGENITIEEMEQGYNRSRIAPDLQFETTAKNYDSQKYAWVTPGFHAIAMDDSSTNCRMRFRTTHGHQIILDDTNERIYISTSGGKTWIEMDEKGNIDFYASRNISFHAEKDINFTTDDTFRVKAKNGIHMVSEGEMRFHAKGNTHLKSDSSMLIQSEIDIKMRTNTGTLYIETAADVDILAGANVIIEAATDISNVAGGSLILDATAEASMLAGGNVLLTGAQIHANGPPASPGDSGTGVPAAETFESFVTNRVPEHEPWPRVMTKPGVTDLDSGNTHAGSAEFTYNDADIGRKERGFDMTRNKNWHR